MLIPHQKYQPIFNGRTASSQKTLHGPPVQIYHQVFGEFKDALASHTQELSPDDLRLSHALCLLATRIYQTGSDIDMWERL